MVICQLSNIAEWYEKMESADIEISTEPSPMGSQYIEFSPTNVTKRSNMNKLGNFVVIDTETTGLSPKKDEIIEVCAIRFRDFKPVSMFSTLLASKHAIPADATRINGITNDMVAGKPYFQQIAKSLLDFVGADNIVGHNLSFDLGFISRYGADITGKNRKYYDTLDLAKKTIPNSQKVYNHESHEYEIDESIEAIENYKLGTLCEWFGINNQGEHRADGDALATGFVFIKLIETKIDEYIIIDKSEKKASNAAQCQPNAIDDANINDDLTAGVEPISAIFDNKTLQSMNDAAFDLYYKGFLAYTKSLTPADMANVDADGIMDQLRRNREELARRAHAGAQVTASGQKQIRPADYSKWKSGAGLVCFWALLLMALFTCAFAVWGAYSAVLPLWQFLAFIGFSALLFAAWYKIGCGIELI